MYLAQIGFYVVELFNSMCLNCKLWDKKTKNQKPKINKWTKTNGWMTLCCGLDRRQASCSSLWWYQQTEWPEILIFSWQRFDSEVPSCAITNSVACWILVGKATFRSRSKWTPSTCTKLSKHLYNLCLKGKKRKKFLGFLGVAPSLKPDIWVSWSLIRVFLPLQRLTAVLGGVSAGALLKQTGRVSVKGSWSGVTATLCTLTR